MKALWVAISILTTLCLTSLWRSFPCDQQDADDKLEFVPPLLTSSEVAGIASQSAFMEARQFAEEIFQGFGGVWNQSYSDSRWEEAEDPVKAKFKLYRKKYGSCRGTGEFIVTGVTARPKDGDFQILVAVKANAFFEKGNARIKIEVGRERLRYDWKVLDLELQNTKL